MAGFLLTTRALKFLLLAMALIFAVPQVYAADYPDKPVTLVVPSSPGGGCDLVSRNFAHYFEKYLGQPVVVLNKEGGGGTIATSYVAKAKPNGYTLLITVIGPILMQPLYGTTDYKRDQIQPVGSLVRNATMIAVNKDSGIRNFEEFLARVKDKSQKPLTISVGAAKGLPHLAVESFARQAGANVKVMPYKGANPAAAATLGGHNDAFCGHPSETLNHVKNGDFIPIAVFSEERVPEFPDTPTFKEKGFPVTIAVWRGLAAPAGTPENILKILESAMAKTVNDPAYLEALKKIGEYPAYLGMDDTIKMWNEEGKEIEDVIKGLGWYKEPK